MTVVLYIVGIVLFLIGISISIGLHELGHLVPAKKFGVKVTHYMVGFGPTVFSFRRGETEYGIKALPLGGFIAMPGMYPPLVATTRRAGRTAAETERNDVGTIGDEQGPSDLATEAPRRPRKQRRGRLFENTMADARDFSNQEIEPGRSTGPSTP